MSTESNKKIAIVDYGIGNLESVFRACKKVGGNPFITDDNKEILAASAMILPGVGAFADAMNQLHKNDLVSPIKDFAASGKPVLGVCLGMQLLTSESHEFGINKGLDLISGTCEKFDAFTPEKEIIKIPQIMWNQIKPKDGSAFPDLTPLANSEDGDYMYFIHSFYVKPALEKHTLSVTTYGENTYASAIQKDNVFGVQFHPEKSGTAGLKIYETFNKLIK